MTAFGEPVRGYDREDRTRTPGGVDREFRRLYRGRAAAARTGDVGAIHYLEDRIERLRKFAAMKGFR